MTGVLAGWVLTVLVLAARRVARPARRGSVLPLGPWLCLGALVAVVVR